MTIEKDNLILIVRENGLNALTDYGFSNKEAEDIAQYIDELIEKGKKRKENK